MYNKQYTLSTTHYNTETDSWVVHGSDSPLPADYTPPSLHSRGPNTYTREDQPDDPHIWSTWGCRCLDTLLSIRSGNQGLSREMYCLAKRTQRSWHLTAERWTWKDTLRPQQKEARQNRTAPTPPRPSTQQLCPYMVAARLMTLLWPRADTPTPYYPPPHRRGHAEHPAVLLQNPQLPPTGTPTCPVAEVDPPLITHHPTHPR